MREEGPSGRFRLKVAAEGVGLVVDFTENAATWYAEGWDAQRVADHLAASAEVWRVEQIVDGGVNSLDEEQVSTLEAGSLFFTLLARMERGEYVSLEELTGAIALVSRRANGVILEQSWSAQ